MVSQSGACQSVSVMLCWRFARASAVFMQAEREGEGWSEEEERKRDALEGVSDCCSMISPSRSSRVQNTARISLGLACLRLERSRSTR